ncbi:ABC transporter permease [Clostridium sp. UBA6640]|uniref:ABC transporter permease n=1 Tax=Clostridium sp. UBA6640 TaxID=1946370 RepID=UPI0025B96CD6|nr:ABC transporter permease [Clostridium sp. UBA6640]
MYILKNALKNLGRNKGRNLMIGGIIFAIILTTVVSLTINNTAASVIEGYKTRFSSEVFITPDTKKVREEFQNYKGDDQMGAVSKLLQIPTELTLQLANSEHLQESVASGMIGAISNDIRPIAENEYSNTAHTKFSKIDSAIVAIGGNGGGDYKLYGDKWKDFNDGFRSLDDDGSSRMPKADNECLVSRELAEKNNIRVGDVITFHSAFSKDNTMRDVDYVLTVVGIYLDLTPEYEDAGMPEMSELNRRNDILTTISTLLSQRKESEVGVQITAKYYLKSADLLPKFEAEARAKGLPARFNVITDTTSYENAVKPIEGLKSISLTFMIVVIALGAIILLLLASISIRERKYEIGVLRAMGMKKGKVALGLWSEILIITCMCLVIGLGVGTLASQPASDTLLKSQVSAIDDTPQDNTMGRTGGNIGVISDAKPLDEMKVNVGLDTVAEIILISLLLASFAGVVSISKITKYEPIKILMERN